MAAAKFYLRSTGANCSIQLHFNISATLKLRTPTGLKINSRDWDKDNGFPIKNRDKNLTTDLKGLATHIEKEYNADSTRGIVFSNDWLKVKINAFFDREEVTDPKEDDNLFSVYLKYYIEMREIDSRTKLSTDRKFKQLQTHITAFEKAKKQKFSILEIDKKFMFEFRKFLIEKRNMMESSANCKLTNTKTVLLDARDNGKTINHQINNLRFETIPAVKVFLSFREIEKIKKLKIIGDDLRHARDWLIIGCYTGQRVSDLLRMNREMIFTKTNSKGIEFQFIELTQEKTCKEVTIPLHDEVIHILEKYDGNFPPTFGKAGDSNFVLFNRHIKKVCQQAGITNVVRGRVFNDDTKRNEITETEKFNLVSSHICRRSFATNFYGDNRFTPPQIMAITGHKTENVFLSYIGKTSSDHAMQTAETFKEIRESKVAN